MIKFALRSLLLAGVTSFIGCSAAKPERQVVPPGAVNGSTNSNDVFLGGLVIFPESRAATSWYLGLDVLPLWSPSTNQVIEALNQIPEYLQLANLETLAHPSYYKHLLEAKDQLPKSICQVVGITLEGRKGVLLSFLPADRADLYAADWRERFINFADGGPRWWSVVYLVEERSFAKLHFDLGY